MGKIKITERQVLMLQTLKPNRTIKLTESQYNRIVNEIGSFNQSINKSELTNNNLVSISEFASEIINFLKGLMISPKTAGVSDIWGKLNTTRQDVFNSMVKIGLLEVTDTDTVNIFRRNIKRKIKSLYDSLNNGKIDEDGGYPLGAEFDQRAPYNQQEPNRPSNVNVIFKVIYHDDEMAILDNNGELYLFHYGDIDKNEFNDSAERDSTFIGKDEDGEPEYEYSDFDIDNDVLEHYVNNNLKHLTFGSGVEDFERGIDIVKINPEFKEYILDYFIDNGELSEILSKVTETTMVAGSSGAFVGPLNGGIIKKETIVQLGDDMEEIDETTVAGASADGGSSGPYVQPKIWAKNKANHKFGNKPIWPNGKIVGKETEDAIEGITENAFTDTQYPKGDFVKIDDCTKLNNNKEAQNGGCSQGSVDNVVKGEKSKNSVVSKEALYYEVSKKTGKTIEEVKKIINKTNNITNKS